MAKLWLKTLIFILVSYFCVHTVSAYSVQFYHAQLRSYQNTNKDHFRVGFSIKDDSGKFVDQTSKPSNINVTTKYTSTGGPQTDLTSFKEGFSVYNWASGSKTLSGWVYSGFNQENYYGARYNSLTSAGDIDVTVNLNGTDFTYQYDYLGYKELIAPDITTLRKKYIDGGLLISWDPLNSAESGVLMRGILNNWSPGFSHETQARLSPTDSEMFIPNSILGEMGEESGWVFQLQMRTIDGFNRYYTNGTDVGSMPLATPIPGAVWLLGTGLIGIIGFRRKNHKQINN